MSGGREAFTGTLGFYPLQFSMNTHLYNTLQERENPKMQNRTTQVVVLPLYATKGLRDDHYRMFVCVLCENPPYL